VTDVLWLMLDVSCAECAAGQDSLVSLAGVYSSLDEAKAGRPDVVWDARQAERSGAVLPGAMSHTGQGGYEIIPLSEDCAAPGR
jgi:hypothetical protein